MGRNLKERAEQWRPREKPDFLDLVRLFNKEDKKKALLLKKMQECIGQTDAGNKKTQS